MLTAVPSGLRYGDQPEQQVCEGAGQAGQDVEEAGAEGGGVPVPG